MLCDVAEKDLPADEKLMTFIYARLDAVKALVSVTVHYELPFSEIFGV